MSGSEIPRYIEGRFGTALWRMERLPGDASPPFWQSLVLLDGRASVWLQTSRCRMDLLRRTARNAFEWGQPKAKALTFIREVLPTLDTRCACASCAAEAEEGAAPP